MANFKKIDFPILHGYNNTEYAPHRSAIGRLAWSRAKVARVPHMASLSGVISSVSKNVTALRIRCQVCCVGCSEIKRAIAKINGRD